MSATALVVLAVVSILPLSSGRPADDKVAGKQDFSASKSDFVSTSGGFQVIISKNSVNGKCMATLTIAGNGIHKKVEYPCDQAPTNTMNLNGVLVVGEYFSDKPGELVHLTNDSCTREVFKGESSSSEESMSKEDCEEVRNKIVVLEEQQKKWWEWFTQQQQQNQLILQQQMHHLQQELYEMQQTMMGGLFNVPHFK